MWYSTAVQATTKFLAKHSVILLTTGAIAGTVVTGVVTAKCTIKATAMLDEYERRLREDDVEAELGFMDKAKIVWPAYMPAVMCGIGTISAIVGAYSIAARRLSTVTGLYQLTDSAFDSYRKATKDIPGVADKVAEATKSNMPALNETEITPTGLGNDLCLDSLSGRYFYASREAIRAAQITINAELHKGHWIDVNDFYMELGLKPCDLGMNVGWDSTRPMDIGFRGSLTNTGSPCLVVEYMVSPVPRW